MEITPALNVILEALDKAALAAGSMQGLPRDAAGVISYDVAVLHINGDSFLDFVVIETVEGSEGYPDEELPNRVAELMQRVADDAQALANAAKGEL